MVEINVFRNSPNIRRLEPGEVLFREGDAGDLMFAVVDGVIELTALGHLVDSVRAGGIVGEMALIDEGLRSATATATSAVSVAPVDRQHFMFLVQEHPTFALLVMQVMADRLRRTNASLPRA